MRELRPMLERDYPTRIGRVSRFQAPDVGLGPAAARHRAVCRNLFIDKDLTCSLAAEDNVKFGDKRRSFPDGGSNPPLDSPEKIGEESSTRPQARSRRRARRGSVVSVGRQNGSQLGGSKAGGGGARGPEEKTR
jgi:hypothetical protein